MIEVGFFGKKLKTSVGYLSSFLSLFSVFLIVYSVKFSFISNFEILVYSVNITF